MNDAAHFGCEWCGNVVVSLAARVFRGGGDPALVWRVDGASQQARRSTYGYWYTSRTWSYVLRNKIGNVFRAYLTYFVWFYSYAGRIFWFYSYTGRWDWKAVTVVFPPFVSKLIYYHRVRMILVRALVLLFELDCFLFEQEVFAGFWTSFNAAMTSGDFPDSLSYFWNCDKFNETPDFRDLGRQLFEITNFDWWFVIFMIFFSPLFWNHHSHEIFLHKLKTRNIQEIEVRMSDHRGNDCCPGFYWWMFLNMTPSILEKKKTGPSSVPLNGRGSKREFLVSFPDFLAKCALLRKKSGYKKYFA